MADTTSVSCPADRAEPVLIASPGRSHSPGSSSSPDSLPWGAMTDNNGTDTGLQALEVLSDLLMIDAEWSIRQ
jgi:hypothetical protein